MMAFYSGLLVLATEDTFGETVEKDFEKVSKETAKVGRNIKWHVTDASITSQVKAKLLADDQVKAYKIKVKTVDKVVYLSGEAPNKTSIKRASQIARQVKGIVNVVNTIDLVK